MRWDHIDAEFVSDEALLGPLKLAMDRVHQKGSLGAMSVPRGASIKVVMKGQAGWGALVIVCTSGTPSISVVDLLRWLGGDQCPA